jgi:hypothetical protein
LVGTNYGTVSDENGSFVFLVPDQDKINLKISSIGFESQTFTYVENPLKISLKPSTQVLEEVVVTTAYQEPRKIVKQAFKSIRNNYFREPILMESFYRHYCGDDGVYGRIIEAQVDLYKKKGYGRLESYESSKDAFEVKELQRSIDQTVVSALEHQPMALDIVLKSDIASLRQDQTIKNKYANLMIGTESFLDTKKNTFTYELEQVTRIDDEEAYKISFKLNKKRSSKSFSGISYTGALYIQTSNYAILRFESNATSEKININQIVNYKNYNGKYALFHSLSELTTINEEGKKHVAHVEFTVENLKRENHKEITRNEIDRVYLSSIAYNEDFWEKYHISIPIPDSISSDLGDTLQLSDQYKLVSNTEKSYAMDEEENAQRLEKAIAENQGILVLDLWASSCVPCIKEYEASERNRALLAEKGAKFLMVSLDENIEKWRQVLEYHGMSKEHHLRIGRNSNLLDSMDVESTPRFLVYHNQDLIEDNAPLLHTQFFLNLVEPFLTIESKANK